MANIANIDLLSGIQVYLPNSFDGFTYDSVVNLPDSSDAYFFSTTAGFKFQVTIENAVTLPNGVPIGGVFKHVMMFRSDDAVGGGGYTVIPGSGSTEILDLGEMPIQPFYVLTKGPGTFNWIGTAPTALDIMWALSFGGDTDITLDAGTGTAISGDFAQANPAIYQMFGSNGLLLGGNDQITAEPPSTVGRGRYYEIYGDAYLVDASGYNFTGGNDHIATSFATIQAKVYGDAFQVDGSGLFTGGDDQIIVDEHHPLSSTGGDMELFGDAFGASVARFVGGDDIISSGTPGPANQIQLIVGDVYFFSGSTSFQGGNDFLEGADDTEDWLYGDYAVLDGLAALLPAGSIVGGADTLYGYGGNDRLDGGPGADTMVGGTGDDTYVVDSYGDVVFEDAGAGTDTIQTSLTSFSIFSRPNFEHLTGTLATGQTLTGNNNNNTIRGQNGPDTLTGGAGRDFLSSSGGIDTLNGGSGDDVMNGGLGNDTLSGAFGNDTFIFNTLLNASTNVDHITDFSNVAGNNDTFWLENAVFTGLATGALSGAAFVANMSGVAADANDRIVYEVDTGRLLFDPDGTGASAATLFAILDNKAALAAVDFFVI